MSFLTKALSLTFLLTCLSFSGNALATSPAAADAESDPHYIDPDNLPSAAVCGTCHETIYEEWSSSAHAYAAVSPMFHKFEQAINSLAPTIDSFCSRCHISTGTTMGDDRFTPIWDKQPVANEGITCVTCHRVSTAYTKVNGERAIDLGPIFDPVVGTSDGSGLEAVLDPTSGFKVNPDGETKGRPIHGSMITSEQLGQSEFCMSCHQVAVNQGIALEVVWNQYRASPALEEGITCQDCHAGKTPGKPDGYDMMPAAIVNGQATEPRKHTNHAFFGPGYSIAHPALFPQSSSVPKALRGMSIQDVLAFDWRAGWGTKRFEAKVAKGDIDVDFPAAWDSARKRKAMRKFITANQEKLLARDVVREELMNNATSLEGPFFTSGINQGKDLSFEYILHNLNSGHNVPSGSLGAQPQLWLNVVLTGPDGEHLWESGYVDSHGDMADIHSLDVRAGTVAYDDQLFSLQTRFLTTNIKGTDREMYLPVNFDIDQLPFLRPAPQPVTVMNHPPGVRMEARSIPPLGQMTAPYSIPGELLNKPGEYTLSVRLRYRAEPIYFMNFVGATQEMIRRMNEGILDIHPYSVKFMVK